MIAGSIVIIPATSAEACSVSAHCYGVDLSIISGVEGIDGEINPDCLSAPAGAFATNEVWLIDPDDYWVEVGFLAIGSGGSVGSGGDGINGPGTFGFWADDAPSHLHFDAHVLQKSPSLTGGTIVEINKNTSTTYRVEFGAYSGSSTTNTMIPNAIEVGSESQSSSAKTYSKGTYMEYEQNGSWHTGTGNPKSPNIDSPQKFSWVTKSTSYHAGISC